MAYIYQHVRLDTNEVFYIGIGRTKSRAHSKHHRSEYWHNIVNKAGYRIDIIAEGITWEQACQKEKELIAYYGRRDRGLGTLVNMTDGGDGAFGHIMSEEAKQKISNGLKGKKRNPHSEETRKKMSEVRKALKGKLPPHSKDRKEKISEFQKNRKRDLHSEESKKKISESVKQNWIKRKLL